MCKSHFNNDSHDYVFFLYPDPPSWSPWNTWTTCECDGYSGEQSRSRTCIDLFPGDGDEECFGEDQESQACELDCTGKAIDVYLYNSKCFTCFGQGLVIYTLSGLIV